VWVWEGAAFADFKLVCCVTDSFEM
jgi:hypothetical protein